MQFNHTETYLDRNWLKACGKCSVHSKYLNSTASVYSLWKQQMKHMILKLYSTPTVSLVPSHLLDICYYFKEWEMGFKVYFIFNYVFVFVSVCVHKSCTSSSRQHASIDGQGLRTTTAEDLLTVDGLWGRKNPFFFKCGVPGRLAMLQWMPHIHE